MGIGKGCGWLWYRLAWVLMWVLSRTFFRMRVWGRENVPMEGPLLLLSNHQSYFDPIFCQVTQGRELWYVARDTLFRNRFFGWLIGTVHASPIKRGEMDMAAMRNIIGQLKEGKTLCLFPEGTRTEDGRISAVKGGLSLITRRTGAKALPVVIDGAYEAWGKGKKRPRFWEQIGVMIGEPFTADEIKEMGDEEFARRFTAKLREMQGELRRKLGKEAFDYGDEGGARCENLSRRNTKEKKLKGRKEDKESLRDG
ncbi:1-acyl-sn-glycerol-3-phosphate acyltransferase [Anaerohalosphaera lusitana]|uniref:1-acyl-sn-glycerol-3-phosphate acyltransferase n=1 Tax=Anaerohalosphaera lusitana TaxID=1936003 RepID=A0A1U9NIM5_9BACT|nr:lysophospholipid acyltransferase family protein [Anaerohalosphaera lusitana]AQT67675.1 1-acyl-sn-glycerol-3-phosphate acyltransferase [Anaerohalosphaera lusitana]